MHLARPLPAQWRCSGGMSWPTFAHPECCLVASCETLRSPLKTQPKHVKTSAEYGGRWRKRNSKAKSRECKALGTTPFFVRLHQKNREQRHPECHVPWSESPEPACWHRRGPSEHDAADLKFRLQSQAARPDSRDMPRHAATCQDAEAMAVQRIRICASSSSESLSL